MECAVEPAREQACLTAHRPATLLYTIRNITPRAPQETQFGTTPPSSAATSPSDETTPTNIAYRLGYEVCADKKAWSLQDQGQGVVDIPEPQQSVQLNVGVVPSGSGSLSIPELTLRWLAAPPTPQGQGYVLTGAQVYNIYHSLTVSVQQNLLTSAGR